MLYFFLNLSILPAVSTSFCLPVKKGWQDEQISTLISLIVERVSITLPQAQVILVISYFGCIPSLINPPMIVQLRLPAIPAKVQRFKDSIHAAGSGVHGSQECFIILCFLHLVNQELDNFDVVHGVYNLA